ncbi:putative endodeoxyribonuclease protein [Vibrio phage 277E43-1]|nr:putative endodeoxyribonuclease protein [Vibrio phage 277E43-1]
MLDAMLDIESMGVGNNPALIQIAAVAFDINTGECGSTFDMKIDLKSSMDAGLSISAGTINFWLTNQSVTQEARNIVMSETGDHRQGGNTLNIALIEFSAWMKENNIKYVHGNGSASDNVWLRSAYEAVMLECPFSFRDDVCFRTLKTVAKRTGWKDDVEREGVYHDGLDDARHQVKVLTSVLDYLNALGKFDA